MANSDLYNYFNKLNRGFFNIGELEHLILIIFPLLNSIIEKNRIIYEPTSAQFRNEHELKILVGQKSIIKELEHIIIKDQLRICCPKPQIFNIDMISMLLKLFNILWLSAKTLKL